MNMKKDVCGFLELRPQLQKEKCKEVSEKVRETSVRERARKQEKATS